MHKAKFFEPERPKVFDLSRRKHKKRAETILGIFLIAFCAVLASCSNTKFLAEDETLLVKNKVMVDDSFGEVDKKVLDDLSSVASQETNTKFLGLSRNRLSIWNRLGTQSDSSWWRRNLGEPPAIFDSSKLQGSARLMENFLYNNGYFNSKVIPSWSSKNKKTTAKFLVQANRRYFIDSVKWKIEDRVLLGLATKNQKQSFLKTKKPFFIKSLKRERERLTTLYKENGFFAFSKDYVHFEIDSSNSKEGLKLSVLIKEDPKYGRHRKYRIDSVTIVVLNSVSDTAKHPIDFKYGDYYFSGLSEKLRAESLTPNILLQRGSLFKLSHHTKTIKKLSELNSFKSIKIQYSVKEGRFENELDCSIQLVFDKSQDIDISIDANTSSETFFGSNLSIGYNIRNIAKRSDRLTLGFRTGVETQLQSGSLFLNTLDIGGEVSWHLPEFLVPFWSGNVSKYFSPKTDMGVKLNYLNRFAYFDLFSVETFYGFRWNEFSQKSHELLPFSLSLTRLQNPTDSFRDVLNDNPGLRASFSNELILGPQYAFTYYNPSFLDQRNSLYFKGQLEVAGSGFWLGSKISNGGAVSNATVFGLTFAQFTRLDLDLRHYKVSGKQNSLVSRIYFGLGLPYGNSEVLPYIRQFYIGGSTSLRAWRIRTLGPGSFDGESSDGTGVEDFVDQTGDLKLEANLEYRFPISGYLKGAVFADAGNIWTLEPDPNRPGAHINGSTFGSQIALGAGIGLRLDFSFFILRLDLASPIYNPVKDTGNRWVTDSWNFPNKEWRRENLVFNLAIGYPF